MVWCPGAPSTVTVTGGHPWFAHPAAIRHHRAPGGFLGCVLESFVHVWFVPGSVPASPVQLVLLNPPRNEQPELLRVSFASPSTLCIKVLGRQRGFGETPGTPRPLARWDGGLGCTPVAWIGWEEDFLNGKCLKSRRVLHLPAQCPALFVPSGSFMLD